MDGNNLQSRWRFLRRGFRGLWGNEDFEPLTALAGAIGGGLPGPKNRTWGTQLLMANWHPGIGPRGDRNSRND